MQVHIDGHSVTGTGHTERDIPCQDAFAYSNDGDAWFIAVADGCTGDGKSKTEEGARLLVKVARFVYENKGLVGRDTDLIGDDIIGLAVNEAATSRLGLADLASTLLLAFPEGDGIRVIMWGDGAFGWRYGNKETRATLVAWAFNTPPYLVYRHSNEAALNMHVMMDHESGVIYQYPGGVKALTGIKDGFTGLEWHIPLVDSFGDQLAWIGLFSDGVERIPDNEPEDVIEALMSGHTGGRFAFRALKKLVADAGLPGDDLTLCCAHFIPETNQDLDHDSEDNKAA